MNLKALMTLPTADRYLHPANKAELLPCVYGDFVSAEYTFTDPTASGPTKPGGPMTPAVLIDTVNMVYCLNIGPSSSAAVTFYIEGVLQNPSTYAYNPDIDYEGKGRIAALAVLPIDLGGKHCGVRMIGMLDSVGTMITNPITMLQHVFTTFGNWLITDFDPNAAAYARYACDFLLFTAHWLFDANRTYGEWVLEIGRHILLDSIVTSSSQLALIIDPQVSVPPELIFWHFDAARDCEPGGPNGDDPEGNPVLQAQLSDVINKPTLDMQYSWVDQEYGYEFQASNDGSISQYGVRAGPDPILLPGIRSAAHALNWAYLYFARQGYDQLGAQVPATLTWSVPMDRVYAFLTPGVYVTMTWRQGPHPQGLGWQKRILKLVMTRPEAGNGREQLPRMAFAGVDTQLVFL